MYIFFKSAKIRVPKTSNVEGLELWAMLNPSKRKNQIWLFRDFPVDTWKSGFFACSPQGFTASTRCSEINVSGHFLLVQTNQVLFEFLKNKLFWSNFGRTTKNWNFAQKTLPFFRKKILKNQKKLRIFEFAFYFHHIWNILELLVSHQKFWKIVLRKSCFLPIRSHKTWKKAILIFPSVTRRRRRWQKIVLHLQPRP
jgi:hypothetical protein